MVSEEGVMVWLLPNGCGNSHIRVDSREYTSGWNECALDIDWLVHKRCWLFTR